MSAKGMSALSRGHYVYILVCADSTLYTGYAADPYERAAAHNAKKGAKYTRSRLPVTLIYYEPLPDKPAALRRERELKSLTRMEKLRTIELGPPQKPPHVVSN